LLIANGSRIDPALIANNSNSEVVKMKKTMIATLAALMLAGALSAVGGATSVSATTAVSIIGEGSAPIPTALPSTDPNSDPSSLTATF
jgi:hypothetical protein